MLRRKITTSFLLVLATAAVSYGQPKGEQFDRFFKSGVELFHAEKYLAAQKDFEKAKEYLSADKDMFAEELEYYMAACAAERGAAEAEQLLENFINRYPNTLHENDIRLALGNMFQKQQDYSRALAEYKEVEPYTLSPAARSEYYFNRGYAAFADKDYGEAIRNFDQVGNDRIFAPSATYYKAYIDYINDRLPEARSGFMSLVDNKNYAPIVPFYILHINFKEKDYNAVVRSAPEVLQQAATDKRKAEILRMTGESYYHLGNFNEASRYLDAYAELHPDLNREEMYMIGYAAYMTGDFDKAVNYLGKVAVGEDLLAQNASFHIGSASLRQGNKQVAKQAFSLAMHLDADKAVKEEAMFNFAKLQYELGGGMFNETINTITQYLEEFPDSPHLDEARSYLLAAYLNSRNYTAAYDAIMKIKNPDNEVRTALQKITYFRGLEYFAEGDYNKAQEMFTLSAENRFNPKYTALAKFWLAETYYRQGEYSRAIPLYQDYIVLSPKGERENILSNYNLGYCYFNLKNLMEAQTWFNRFNNLYKQQDGLKADTYNRLGDISFMNKAYSRAIEDYDRSMKIGTDEADYAQFQRAIALGLTAGADKKIDALKSIINAGRTDYVDDAMYELGATYTKKEQFNEAASTLQKFIAKYPGSPFYLDALSDLGLIYQNMGKNDEAMKYYKMVVDKHPNSSQSKDALLGIRNIYVDNNDLDGYFSFAAKNGIETNVSIVERDSLTFNVAERIYLSGDAKRAQPLLQTYLAQFPKGSYVANATYYVADCQMQAGDTDAALQGYEKVLAMQFNPFTNNSLLNAGSLNFQKGNYEAAAGQYRKLSELSTNRNTLAEALSGYIRSVDKLNNPDQAIAAADYVLNSAFLNDELRNETDYVLGKAYLAKGDKATALASFRKAAANIKTRNGSESQYYVGELLNETGNLDEAEAEVLKFAETNTSHQYWLGKAFLTLGDVYVKKGDAFQAKATYQSIVDGYSDKTDGIVDEAAKRLSTLK